MSGFLYAINSDKTSEPPPRDVTLPIIKEVLHSAGLNYLDGVRFSITHTPFPLLTPAQKVWVFATCGYGKSASLPTGVVDINAQIWHRVSNELWIGYWKSKKPKSDDLQRKDIIWSSGWEFGDTGVWLIPIVPIDLPQVMRIVDNVPKMVPHDAYVDLMDIAKKYWDYRRLLIPYQEELEELSRKAKSCEDGYKTEMDKLEPNKAELERLLSSVAEYHETIRNIESKLNVKATPVITQAMDCVRVISKNYYVTEHELSMLGVLTTKAIHLIIRYSFLDHAPVEEQELAEKKG